MSTLETFHLPAHLGITLDLYKDVHKAIRVAELSGLMVAAGQTDPSDGNARAELAARVRANVDLLDTHAHHEDAAIGPVLEAQLPDLAEQIARDHQLFDGRGAYLVHLADAAVEATGAERRHLVHHLYLDVAGFTSAYLAHQDVEERTVMPALEAAVGPDAVMAIHQQILGNIPPDVMGRFLALMIPAMNLDDRTEMLGGMRATAPDEVFQGVWGLAGSVLAPADHQALAARLGLN